MWTNTRLSLARCSTTACERRGTLESPQAWDRLASVIASQAYDASVRLRLAPPQLIASGVGRVQQDVQRVQRIVPAQHRLGPHRRKLASGERVGAERRVQ